MEVIIYVCVLISFLCDFVRGVRFVEQPSGVTVVEGETIILRCVVADKGTDVLFWKTMASAAIISNDTDIDPYNTSTTDKRARYSIIGDHEAGEYHLQIVNATREDSGRYSCLYYTHFNHYSRIATVRIMIPPDPGYPKCSVHPHGATAGDTVRLTCRSSGGDPPATLAWVSGSSILRMYMPQNPNPINKVSYILKDDDLNRVFTCAATTPALQQPLSCSVVPYRKKMFVFVQPVVNRVMEGEYANFHCITHKKSGTIRWVIGSTPVDPSDPRFVITRKGKRLRVLQTVRSEHDNKLVSCQVMDRFGVAGNGSSLLIVNSWGTTTQFMPTELTTEIVAVDSDVGSVSPVEPTVPVSTNVRTTSVPFITKEHSVLSEQSAIRHTKKISGSMVTTPTVTTVPLGSTVTKTALVPTVTKAQLVSTTREATTVERSTRKAMTDSLSPAYNTKPAKMSVNGLLTVSAETSTRKQSKHKGTSVPPQSVQTMTTKQMYLTTESLQSTRLMRKSTIAFDTLSSASSNVQTMRVMSSAVTMDTKTDDEMHSTKKIIVHDMNDRTDISNEIIVTRGTQVNNMVSPDSNDIFIYRDNSVTKNMTETNNDTASQQATGNNNNDKANNELLGKSTNVLIGGLVGLVILIIIVIVLSIVYLKRRRETTEIKAV